MGELIRAIQMPETLFNAEIAKLRGMNETSTTVTLPSANANADTIRKKIYECSNVLQVPSSDDAVLKFAGKTLASKSLVLVQVKILEESGTTKADIGINCEKIVVGSMLAKELKKHLEQT
jgi:AP-3 complex subunit beta